MLGGITGKGFMPGVSGNPYGRPSKHGKRVFEQARALASLSAAPARQNRPVRDGEVIWYRRWDGSYFPTVNNKPISEEQVENYARQIKTHEFREYSGI